MFRRLLLVSVLVMAGCATTVPGTGRFGQASMDGKLVMQMDMNSPAECQAEMAESARKAVVKMDLICNTVSGKDSLPSGFMVRRVITDSPYAFVRFLNYDACTIGRREISDMPKASDFRFGDCNIR
jgi:hypothetical protein